VLEKIESPSFNSITGYYRLYVEGNDDPIESAALSIGNNKVFSDYPVTLDAGRRYYIRLSSLMGSSDFTYYFYSTFE